MTDLERIIAFSIQNGCSDIHLTEGLHPYVRKNGTLHLLSETGAVTRDIILQLASRKAVDDLNTGADVDFAANFGGGRQRINIYRESGKLVAAVRLLNDSIPTLESLGMPDILKTLSANQSGLILVTGPTGSGKSTTLAAMINHVCNTRRCHIITIEDPIEYRFSSGNSLIHQREVGKDVKSFGSAIRSSLREDPDVLMVGEMRDYETMSAAITTAETGHLVFSTLHTTSAVRTVERIIDVFPPEAKAQVRTQLSGVLRGVITQKLIPSADGGGRVAASEILLGTDPVLNLIREGKTHQIASVMQSGGALGMRTIEYHLAELVRQKKISREAALENSPSKDEFLRLSKIPALSGAQ